MTNLQDEHALLQEEHLLAKQRIAELEQENAILKAPPDQGGDSDSIMFGGWHWK